MRPAPSAPQPRPSHPGRLRARPGRVLGRLFGTLGALVGVAAVLAVVAILQGWIVVQPGGGIATRPDSVLAPVAVAGMTPGATPGMPAQVRDAGGEVAPSNPPTDSVGTVTLDPAHAPPTTDSAASGAGTGAGGRSGVTATASELAALRSAMTVPVAGVPRAALRDDFEQRRGAGDARQHDALDIPAPRGTAVVAATAGRVLKLFDSRQGGLTVYTSDPTGRFVFLYGHLERYAPGLREGMPVRQGQPIGTVGSSGNASPSNPHLHFGVARTSEPGQWNGGTTVNPFELLRE